MNKFAIIFLVLFMGIIILIGVLAVRNDVSTQSRAANSCPPERFPEDATCPEGQRMQLTEDAKGCYSFACK